MTRKLYTLGEVPGPKLAEGQFMRRKMNLTDHVRDAVSPMVRPHVIGAGWQRSGVLVVTVDSDAWCDAVKQCETDIAQGLQTACCGVVKELVVMTCPPLSAAAA